MRLLTMPEEEKIELVNAVLANFIKISGEQFDGEAMAVIVGLVFGQLMEQASSRSPSCSTASATRDLIMRDICESDPADPEEERTVCINYERLYEIVTNHLTFRTEKGR